MKSKAQVKGHPIHPMLVMFPVALFPVTLLFDLVYLWRGEALWWTMAFWIALLGVIGTGIAIIPGLIDYTAIPRGSEAKHVATLHMVNGLIILALTLGSVLTRDLGRTTHTLTPWIPVGLLLLSNLLLGLQGWWGGELTYRHAVGVHPVDPRAYEDAAFPARDTSEASGPRPGGGLQ